MNLLRAAELKVGILVLSVASLIAYMSLQVSEDPSYLGRSNEAWFLISDAGGLVKNSSVRTAGIPIGVIKNISLQDGMARVDLTLRSDIKLYVSATVEMKSQGILGDRYVEIGPGSPSDPPLPRKGQIVNIKQSGSLDNVVSAIGDIAGELKETAKVLREAVTEEGTNKHVLGRIVRNIEKLTADVAQMTGDNKEKINDIVDQIHGITDTLDEALNDESEEGFKKTWKRTLSRIDSTMKNVEEISDKINRGEGTIGKLVSDEQMAEDVSSAIDGINSFVGSADKLQAGLDFNAYYLNNVGATKSTIGIRLQPGLDRYYYLGIVDDPAGVVETTDTATSGSSVSNITEVKTYRNRTKFNAIFAKNFYNFTVKGGLIENAGGFGLDYHTLRDKLRLSLELFEFSQLNVRAQAQYSFSKGIYMLAGVSDALDRSGKFSTYIGAGLLLTNDDLKILMSALPTGK